MKKLLNKIGSAALYVVTVIVSMIVILLIMWLYKVGIFN